VSEVWIHCNWLHFCLASSSGFWLLSIFFSGCGDFFAATRLLENHNALRRQRLIQRPFLVQYSIFATPPT
jgi:hypothetical protein